MALGTVLVNFIAKTQAFERDLNRTRKHLTTFQKTAMTAQKTLRAFGSALGVSVGFYAINRAVQASVREFAAFEKQMANVSTLLDEQGMKLMPRYSAAVRQMSVQFGESTETLSKGLYDIISASIDTAKALGVLDVSVRAAKAGMTDTGIAADAITTILNSYDVSADRAGDVSDKLFTIVKRGKTTFGELAPNIGKVTSVAATAGVSFDDLGASLATMTRAGVQTEIAITSLRAILLAFIDPQKEAIETAKKYDLALNDLTLRKIGLRGVVEKLAKASAQELSVIVPSSRAITGFAANVRKASGVLNDYNALLESSGANQEALEKVNTITAYQIEQLNQEWIDLKRTIGEAIALPLGSWLHENFSDIKRYASDVAEGVNMVASAVSNLKKVIPAYWIYRAVSGGGESNLPMKRPPKVTDQAAWERWLAFQKKVQDERDKELKAPPAPEGGAPTIDSAAVTRTKQLMDQLDKEIALTGRLGEARQHARMQIEFEAEAIKAYGEGTTEATEAVRQFEAKLKDLEDAQKLARIADDIGNAFTSAFDAAIIEGEKLRNVIRSLLNDIARSIIHQGVSVPIGQFISSGIGEILNPTGGGGGFTPTTPGGQAAFAQNPYRITHLGTDFPSISRRLPSSVFNQAPRLHDGLRANEFPAILERGETVVPKGGNSGPVQLIFNSPDAQSAYQLFYSNRRALATVLRGAMDENHTLRRSER